MAIKAFNSIAGFSVGNVPANIILGNGDITAGNANFSGNGNVVGNLSTGNANLGNLATANYFVGNFQGKFANGNSDINIPAANGNINLSAGGNANILVITPTGAYIQGTLDVTGNVTVGNVLITPNSVVIGNTTLNSNGLAANSANISGTANIANLVVTGNANISGNANVTGNISAGNIATAGTANIANLTANFANITANLYVVNTANIGNVRTDNLLYANGQPWDLQQAAGQNTWIQYNDGNNNFGASNNLTYDYANGIFTVGTNDSKAGNINANNINASNNVNATGNVSGAYILGNGYYLTNINTSIISNGNSNVQVLQNSNVAISVAGNSNVLVISGTGINVNSTINSGNITANGNISANAIAVTDANVSNATTSGSVITSLIKAPVDDITITTAIGNYSILLRPTGNGTIDAYNARITSVGTPNNATDAVNKQYVDDFIQGLNIHDACLVATPDTLANITGGIVTYNNGVDGVGANLTTTTAYTLIDNVSVANVGTRILVKSETDAAWNGIYVYSNSTVITRASDYNTVPEVEAGDYTFVSAGDTYASTGWVQVSTVAIIGTDPIVFTQFSGSGTYTAGSGIALNGTQFSANTDGITTGIVGGNIAVIANAQFTTPNIGAATGTSLIVTGNLSGNNLSISNEANVGTNLNVFGNIQGNNISSNGNVTGNNLSINNVANVGTNLNVSGNIQGNTISSNGNVSGNNLIISNVANVGANLNVFGNIQGNNISSNGNVTGNNLSATNNVSAGANIIGSNITSNNSIIANANITANAGLYGNSANILGNIFTGNITVNNHSNLGSISNITITGGNANYVITTDGQGNLSWVDAGSTTIISNISNGTSNVNIPVANGNINLTAGGNTTLIVTPTGANVQGNINVANGFSVNGFFGNVGQFLTANGNNGFNWQSHFFTGNTPPDSPNYGDIWYLVDDTANPPTNVIYMWVFDGTSEYFFDFLPPNFLNT